MKQVRNLIGPAIIVMALSSGTALADAKADATAACDAGKSAMNAAKKAGMLWTTTKKLMKKADAAMEKGEFEAAMKACKKAKFQGDASVKQASLEADAWKARVPR